jgi:ParB-like chromosome segregation protein Spo0J
MKRATGKMKAHPYAELFPMMTPDELEALADDIAENGLRHPITQYQGAILDGRNRLAACEKAGKEPRFVEHDGDDPSALALVISENVQRRDLTAGQRALVAARALPMFEELRRKRMAQGGRTKVCTNGADLLSREQAGKLFKAGVNQVQQAKALLKEAPDLAAQVETKVLNITAAYAVHQQREEDRRRKEKQQVLIRKYQDAVDSGEMTFEQAIEKVVKEAQEEQQSREYDAQARQLFFKQLADIVKNVKTWIGDRSDEHLAWYVQPDAPGTEHEITAEQIDETMRQLRRVKAIVFKRP